VPMFLKRLKLRRRPEWTPEQLTRRL